MDEKLVSLLDVLIRWIVIYALDSAILRSNIEPAPDDRKLTAENYL